MRIFASILVFSLLSTLVNAQQKVRFNHSDEKSFTINGLTGNSLNSSFSMPQLVFGTFKTDEETYLTLFSEGFGKCYKPGEPDLPVYNQLIVVPSYINISLLVNNYNEELIPLSSIEADKVIKPAIASISKSQTDPDKIPFIKGKAYQTNEFTNSPVVELREVGIMRDVKIYELVYQPVLYNAVTNEIKVRHQANIELQWSEDFIGSDVWDFTNLGIGNLNPQSPKTNELRETYVIVSPSKFKETLQPFILWKKQQGFNVLEAYVGESIASNDKNVIKTYLKGLYTSPVEGVAAPSYLLIVGDVADIPTWSGTTDSHVTDLYYAEYTGDFLPEVYYGRFSANNTLQLQTIIDKTLYVEKGAGNLRSYQNEHLLISGVDGSFAPIYGNGAINYFMDYYSVPEFGINTHYYLYGSGSPIVSNSLQAKEAILEDFDAGLGIAYYTAHCSQNGWSDPEFSISDIASVNNTDKYPLMIGNCCQSYSFNSNSFGEEIVRAPGKGAVVYIGATNYSYWDEDYFWGIGFTSNIVANPTYESTGLGSWDAWFHTHNETQEQHAYTAGQIMYVGNMAVQSSNSNLKDYYWEIYGIMGDPSLVPAKFQTTIIEPQFNEVLMVGQNSLTVSASKGAMVTLSEKGVIMAYGKIDDSNVTTLSFEPLLNVGDKLVEMCVTHPDFAPYIDTLRVIGPDGPYLVLTNVMYHDSIGGNDNQVIDFDENIDYFFEIKNFGNQDAQNITATINSPSQWIEPLGNNNSMEIPTIKTDETFLTEIPFTVGFKNNVPDQELVSFIGLLNFNDSISSEFSFSATVNAPQINETNWLVDQSGVGNGNGIIEANEEVTMTVFFTNLGHSQVSNTTIDFTSLNNDLLTVISGSFNLGGIDISETKSLDLLVKGGNEFIQGAQAFLKYEITAGDESQYFFSDNIAVVLGQVPDILMHNGTEEIVTGNFYDSGGANGKYANNENYTLTLSPHNPGEGLMLTFDEFDVESSNSGSCWDKLSIYDGSTTEAPLIGSFCTANYLNYVQSQNATGALTFKFESDLSAAKNGWKAFVSSSPKSTVTFNLTNGTDPIPEALIEFVNSKMLTDASGAAVFSNSLSLGTKKYTITKTGYFTKAGTIEELNGDTTLSILLEKLPDICFTVFDNTLPLADVVMTFNDNTLITDVNGSATFLDVLPGSKNFRATKIGYVDTTGTIVVGTIDYCYTLNMHPKPTYKVNFIISDEFGFVGDAIVSLNGVEKATSLDGIANFEGLYEGNYGFTVEKEGYSQYTGALNFTDSDLSKEISISHITYGAVFTVTNKGVPLENAEISILGDIISTASNGKASMYGIIPADNIPFEITKAGYINYVGTFNLIDTNVELNVELTAVGINQNKNQVFTVHPNPISKSKKLTVGSIKLIDMICLYNYTGAMLVTLNGPNKEFNIDFSGFSSGIYILQAKVGDEMIFEKVIVE